MGVLSRLPPEIIALIVDDLRDDRPALRACALASHVLLPRCRAHLFGRITLWNSRLLYRGGKTITVGNTDAMRTYISSGPDGVLSYARSLSIYLGPSAQPRHLEEIFDHLMAFKNVRELQARLSATHFVEGDFTLLSRYFSHFQPTLRRLHLDTSLKNPKDLITLIAFFPHLEEVSIDKLFLNIPSLPDSKSDGFDLNLLSPLKGSLQLSNFRHENDFATELAKVRVQYHTLSICNATVWTGVRELIVACAPTLRVLNVMREAYDSEEHWDPLTGLSACAELTEINLPFSLRNFSSNIRSVSTLLSTISSPHLRKITLTLDKDQPVCDIKAIANWEWRILEDALLGVSFKSWDVLEVVIVFSTEHYTRSITDSPVTFLPRFKEVGKVRVEFPWIKS